MNQLIGTWACYFAIFYLACLCVGLLSRRGFIPLHVSALVGTGAYVFAALCGKPGFHPVTATFISLLATMAIATISGLVFLRVRGPAAAMATISMQFLFDRYVSTVAWTGGSAGTSQGLPILAPTARITFSVISVFFCGLLYMTFQRTSAARLLVVDGHSPLLSAFTTTTTPVIPVVLVNLLVGVFAGCAGLLLSLQTGFISPSSFSLNWSLLYAGTILLVGWRSLAAIAVGAFVLSLFPDLLRYVGFGQSDWSAWRGVVVGIIVALVVWLQFPRMVPSAKQMASAENDSRC
jgi:ABC-type branched-subunit amino acid transport system permease subunit